MLCAFLAAGIAHVGADSTQGCGEFAAACHIAGRHAADLRAVHIERDAARHHFYIIFRQAGGRAMIARSGARITRIDTFLELFVRHENLLGKF